MLDVERAGELFAAFGPVRCRPMFGGTGVYARDVMFALEVRDVLYLKTDASTQAPFEAEGCGPFSYDTARGKRTIASYWRAPDRLLDDPEELAAWAVRALAVALSRKQRSPRKRPGQT
ncbi:MAG TPA: TfoX/Sxy family protein [Hansschlegelia sp.]